MSDTTNEVRALIRLLDAMAQEWASFAADFSGLGEALSDEAVAEGNMRNVAHIQRLDALGQLVLSQSDLLAQIACRFAIPSESACDIERAITSVPFHHSRERLSAALRGDAREAANSQDSDAAVHWF